jgi:hypothetical protein
MKIKRGFMFLLAHALYATGHLFSLPMTYIDWKPMAVFYRPYNWCMLRSFDISQKYDLDMWAWRERED